MDSLALVDAWEDGCLRNRIERPLVLLAASNPDTRESDWARLPIGERDARLLGMREEIFGTRLNASANCPMCGERAELSFETEEIRVPIAPLDSRPEEYELADGDYRVSFRLPTTSDLRHVAQAGDPRSALLSRCVVSATTAVLDLPTSVLEAVVERMGEADPQAVVELSVDCPGCGHAWSVPFDIASFLWNEVDDLVGRLSGEVHSLASAYGWTEREILSMSPLRRRVYLERVG